MHTILSISKKICTPTSGNSATEEAQHTNTLLYKFSKEISLEDEGRKAAAPVSLSPISQPALMVVCDILMTFKLLIHAVGHKLIFFRAPQLEFPSIILCSWSQVFMSFTSSRMYSLFSHHRPGFTIRGTTGWSGAKFAKISEYWIFKSPDTVILLFISCNQWFTVSVSAYITDFRVSCFGLLLKYIR